MADLNFRFGSTGADQLARDQKKIADTSVLAARGARLAADAIEKQRKAAGVSAGASLALAKADDILKEAEHGLAEGALEAEFALKREAEAERQAARDALEAAAANKALGDSFDKLARKAGGASLLGTLGALSPALIPVTAGVAAGVGAIGVSFGAAAAGAGLFAALAKTAFGEVSTAADAYQKAQAKAAAAPATAPAATRAQLAAAKASLAAAQAAQANAKGHAAQAAAQARVSAAQARLNQLEGQGTQVSKQRAAALKAERQALAGLTGPQRELVKSTISIKTEWKDLSLAVATPVLAPWMSAAARALTHLRPLVQPVADLFRYWGESVDAYFGSQRGSAEITRLAAAFGRFSATQLRDLGIFVVDIGKGVASLGRDLAGHNVDFGTFGTHLDQWGTAFQRWSGSSAARQDVNKFLAYVHANGPAVKGLLKNLGGALAAFSPGLTSAGSLELRLVSDFLGFLARTPKGIAKPLTETAGALLLLQKTGVLKVGIKIVGAAVKWLTGGVISIGSGAAAAGEMRAAFATGGAAAAAEIRAALAGGGAVAGAGNAAGGLATAGRAGVAVEGAGAGLAALLAPVVAGALGGLIIAAWVNQFRTAANQHPPPARQQGPRGSFSADTDAWKQYDQAVTSAGRHVAAFPVNTLAAIFATTGKGAAAARTEVGAYTTAIVQNGLNSDQAKSARDKLIKDMTAAGISAGTARSDVSAYSLAVEVNGARSDQARDARRRLNADIEKAFRNSQQGKADLAGFTTAVTRHSAQSDAVRGARQRLISDLIRAGTDAGTARTDVSNLQAAINKMHGKGISISMSGKGYYTISEAGKNYQISAGGLFSPHAAGGLITGGMPGRDSVLGMLMPGEVIVPTSLVKAGAVDHLRGMLPGFAAGGTVGPLRTGEAGIGRFYKADVNDEGYSLVAAMRKALKASEAKARAAAQAGSSVPAGGGGAARWKNQILTALGMLNQSGSWLGTVERRMNQESGGNPSAINKWDSNWAAGTPSVGVMQVIGPTYRAYSAPGWRNLPPMAYGVSEDVLANTYAGLHYALGRYGSLSALNRPGGYAKGGQVPGYASGGVAGQGAAWLKAWQSRHGGGFGAAWGPVVLNEQIARMAAAVHRAQALAGASGLSPGQHRFWAGAAAGEKKRLAVLHKELTTERAWRYQLQLGELGLDSEIRAAGNLPGLAGPVKEWKAQLGRDKARVAAISKMLGYSDAYLAAHKPPRKVTPPGVPGSIPHTGAYTDSTADLIAQLFAAAASSSRVVTLDSGGWLMPGVQAVANKTGRPEQVLPPGRGGGSGGGDTYVINAPHYVGSHDDLVRALSDLKRQGRLPK